MAEQQGSSSKAGEPSAANVFSGERSKEGYALTNAELFKLVDKVVYPGHADGEEVKGKPSEADRFAKVVCGTPASSGYTRVSTMRTKTNVKREYDSLQEYQCATCKTNLAANLALRPPTEKMRVYIPGPEILQSSSQKLKCEAVFTDIHAEELEQAGYVQVEVNFHAPDLALQGFDPLKIERFIQDTFYLDDALPLLANLDRRAADTFCVSLTVLLKFCALIFLLFLPSSLSSPLLRFRMFTSPSTGTTPEVSALKDVVVPPEGQGLNEKILSSPRVQPT